MKKVISAVIAMILMLSLGAVSLGCESMGQIALTQSASGEPATGTGTLEVHITDAPPEEEVTSVLVTVSRVEIHKAGSSGDTGQEQEEQEQGQTQGQDNQQLQAKGNGKQATPLPKQQQLKEQEQKQEKVNQGQKAAGKQNKGADNGKKNGAAVKEPKQAQEQVRERENNGDGGGWINIDITGGTTFDLLKIKGLDELFAASQVAAGKYTQVRLTVDKVEVGLGGKAAEEVKLPSGELKLVHPFEVADGETTEILLDFDAAKSVNVTGNGKVMVKPVIKMGVKQKSKGNSAVKGDVTQEDCQKTAEQFLKTDETYAYDGITDSLALTGAEQGVNPGTWSFTFEFDCGQAGYGNRTNQALAQVITHHTAVIMVEQGKVTSAVIDGKWDMIKEEEIGTLATATSHRAGVLY